MRIARVLVQAVCRLAVFAICDRRGSGGVVVSAYRAGAAPGVGHTFSVCESLRAAASQLSVCKRSRGSSRITLYIPAGHASHAERIPASSVLVQAGMSLAHFPGAHASQAVSAAGTSGHVPQLTGQKSASVMPVYRVTSVIIVWQEEGPPII